MRNMPTLLMVFGFPICLHTLIRDIQAKSRNKYVLSENI